MIFARYRVKIWYSCHLFYVISKLKDKIRRYFGFSATETNGLMLLVPFVLIVLMLPGVVRKMLEDRHQEQITEDEKILHEWLAKSRQKIRSPERVKSKILNPFDPNQISIDDWVSLGFSKKIAKRIIRFRQKGGRFNKKQDLLKIYGIDKNLASSYFDLLIFPDLKSKPKKSNKSKSLTKKTKPETNTEIVKLDLNLADTTQLQKIKGIGPVLSSRIVNYRQALGGFHAIDQINEVYGIKADLFKKLEERFEVKSVSIKKVNINEDSIKLLTRHPYLSYRVSKALVKYRKQHGDYRSIEDIKKIHIINDSIFNRISVYLKTTEQNEQRD